MTCLRLLCFLAIVLMVFIDIYIAFSAEWKRDLAVSGTGNNPQNTMQYILTLWNDCNIPPTTRQIICDGYYARIGGGTAPAHVVAWRAIMVVSIILLIISGGLALLSLDCVQMSEAKKKMAVLSGILVIVGGNLIHIVAVWFTILHLPIGGTRGDIGAFVGSRIDLDVYDATPGAGLIFGYVLSYVAIIVGILLICYSSDTYDLEEYETETVGLPRHTLMSAAAGLAGMAAPNAYHAGRMGRSMSVATGLVPSGLRRQSVPMSMMSRRPTKSVIDDLGNQPQEFI